MIVGTYPVQSLYYQCLNCLRKNYMLINFTVISKDIGDDVIASLRDRNHLKKFRSIPYRNISIYNFESYIYKNYFEKMSAVRDSKYLKNSIDSNDFYEYIPGILTIGGNPDIIYNPNDGKCYVIDLDYYNYRDKIHEHEFKDLYPDMELRVNSRGYIKIVSEKFFDKYPGLAEWAESLGYISQKLWIPENLFVKK